MKLPQSGLLYNPSSSEEIVKETARNPEILQLGSPYYLNPVLHNTFRVISYGK